MDSSILSKYQAISLARNFSDQKIQELRNSLSNDFENENEQQCSVVIVGSLARREASAESDVDYFLVHRNCPESRVRAYEEKTISAVRKCEMRSPSKGGAFASIISYDQLLSNIGGFSDDNNNLTRRILFLLESDWLYNENLLAELRKEIINRYVRASITQHALCRFLLNDIIRYYRTLCVDFEFKTCETDKSWGDRNIKLAFSRKLMYFSGVLVLAETVQQTCEKKRSILNEYFSKDPIRRLTDICGIQAEKALKYYDQFLQALSDESSRELLQRTTDDRDNHSEEFRNLKNMGHHFSWELFNVLNKTYPPSHPIHMCLCI